MPPLTAHSLASQIQVRFHSEHLRDHTQTRAMRSLLLRSAKAHLAHILSGGCPTRSIGTTADAFICGETDLLITVDSLAAAISFGTPIAASMCDPAIRHALRRDIFDAARQILAASSSASPAD